ncbi:NAD-dependent succinate-semialdehyde dehydrogenase [Nocardioides sp. LS1]|uniref:NAD-dependent succinate-semialdehyde dehydrogenase n=1 Tax=Nocardioides sp. LS1 TaxID=1027620 RepID=UPI000FFAEA71|nr:NAD-dependent succinate-semialdehyde dehydrogenase [Nocardioides sp. LS1]GCD91178.1 NAD-dependent succinate-semialdehyde dehydrogenase [Nocardioides sp. LS1]
MTHLIQDLMGSVGELVETSSVRAFINGQWVNAANSFEVDDPSSGATIASVANCGLNEADAAVDAASGAGRAWAPLSPLQRADLLHRTYALMMRDEDRLADLIALENGKSRSDAAAEVRYAAQFFRWNAEEAVRIEGHYAIAPNGLSRTVVSRTPVGVAALVTPWNFPAAMPARKVAPALAAGCTVVLKPAAETPLTAIAMVELLVEAGVPAGVVNVVTTVDAADVVDRWLSDSRVRKLSFTGSTPVGRSLLRTAAGRVLNCSMELGGAAPFVVLPDADLGHAVRDAVIAKFRGGGQACTAANSFHVHASVAEEFVDRLASEVGRLTVGPSRSGAAVGPLISARAVTRLTKTVDDAVTHGAQIVARGDLPGDCSGYFFPPTVLTDVAPSSSLATEELFGPVAPVLIWDDTDELVARLNRSEYGLAAYVQSRDIAAGMKFADRIDAGMVAVNRGVLSDPAAPFGGMKQSGLGREGAQHGLHEFTEIKYLSVDWSQD